MCHDHSELPVNVSRRKIYPRNEEKRQTLSRRTANTRTALIEPQCNERAAFMNGRAPAGHGTGRPALSRAKIQTSRPAAFPRRFPRAPRRDMGHNSIHIYAADVNEPRYSSAHPSVAGLCLRGCAGPQRCRGNARRKLRARIE